MTGRESVPPRLVIGYFSEDRMHSGMAAWGPEGVRSPPLVRAMPGHLSAEKLFFRPGLLGLGHLGPDKLDHGLAVHGLALAIGIIVQHRLGSLHPTLGFRGIEFGEVAAL